MVQVRNGSTVSMWHDMWKSKVRLMGSPELYSFTTKINITLSKAKRIVDFHDIFLLLLTNEAYQQYNILILEIENLELNAETDKWTYIWETSQYSVHKAYSALIGHMPTHLLLTVTA
jgi:hypothetical protein